MGLKQRIGRFVAGRKFSSAGAAFEISPEAQIRSITFSAKKNSVFRLGRQSIFAGRLSMDREGAFVSIGNRSYFGKSHLVAAERIEIGDDVLISWGVTILDHHSHSVIFEERKHDVINWLTARKDWSHVPVAPVKICDKVWIGFGATVMPGVVIGEGAIVGACTVVTKDVAPWTVVAGNPA